MSDEPANSYQEAKDRVARTDSVVRRVVIGAALILLIGATIAVILGASSFHHSTGQLNGGIRQLHQGIAQLQHNQTEYHASTQAEIAANQCQAKAYKQLLTELAELRDAQVKHLPLPPVELPAPC